MKLGAYTAVLHDKPLPEALGMLKELGLEGAEINSGGFLPPLHLPVADIKASQGARDEYLAQFSAAGITLTALNCNGNPLHPDPEVRDKHGNDVKEAIELAALLGVTRVITMSGLPASDPDGHLPAWSPLPWESSILDARDYQWNEVAIPYWKDIQARAADADVKVCIEMHPHNVVYNPATMERAIAAAAAEGARVLVGGERDGSVVAPTVVADVDPASPFSQQELFGPAVAVSTAADWAAAVAQANGTSYGLSAGIFTGDVTGAVRAIREIDAGNIHINWTPLWRADLMPYGGLKGSGIGKEGPRWAVAEMTEEKTVVLHGRPWHPEPADIGP